MGLVPEERIELSSNEHESFVLTFVLFWYKWCGMTDSNRRPLECKSKALPAELIPHTVTVGSLSLLQNLLGEL